MKKWLIFMLVLSILLIGCDGTYQDGDVPPDPNMPGQASVDAPVGQAYTASIEAAGFADPEGIFNFHQVISQDNELILGDKVYTQNGNAKLSLYVMGQEYVSKAGFWFNDCVETPGTCEKLEVSEFPDAEECCGGWEVFYLPGDTVGSSWQWILPNKATINTGIEIDKADVAETQLLATFACNRKIGGFDCNNGWLGHGFKVIEVSDLDFNQDACLRFQNEWVENLCCGDDSGENYAESDEARLCCNDDELIDGACPYLPGITIPIIIGQDPVPPEPEPTPDIELEEIRIENSGDSNYILSFNDADNKETHLPIGVVNDNKYYLGDTYSESPASARYTILNELSVIKKNDYFVVTNLENKASFVFQYKGSDKYTSDDTTPTMTFKEIGTGDSVDVTYKRGEDVFLKYAGHSFKVEASSADTSNDFDIRVDLDASGSIGNILSKDDSFYTLHGTKLQYKGAEKYTSDNANPVMTFKVVETGEPIEITWNRGQDTILRYETGSYRILNIGPDTQNDFKIRVDLDVSAWNRTLVPIYTGFGAKIEIESAVHASLLRGEMLSQGIYVKISTPEEDYEDISPLNIRYKLSASGTDDKVTLAESGGVSVTNPTGDTENYYGMTSYGARVHRHSPTNGIPKVYIVYPSEQRFPKVLFWVSANDNWQVKSSNNNLELGNSQSSASEEEAIKNITSQIGANELQALSDGKFAGKGYSQNLYFDKYDSGFVQFMEYTDTDIQADHFIIPNNKQIARYVLEFDVPIESDVDNSAGTADLRGTYLSDYQNLKINLLGREYIVVQARRSGGNTASSLKLVLMTGETKTTLNQGSKETLEVNGKDYEVELTYVDSNDRAAFVINGEPTGKINVGDTYHLSDNTKIGVSNVYYQALETGTKQATFFLGAEDMTLWDTNIVDDHSSKYLYMDGTYMAVKDARVKIKGSDDNITFKINSIEVNMTAGDDLWVAPGEKLSDIISARGDKSEVLFTQNWDIYYRGLSEGSMNIPNPEPVQTCIDSDGGEHYEVKGKITAIENGIKYESEDECGMSYDDVPHSNPNILNEKSCRNDGEGIEFLYECQLGCEDGSCLQSKTVGLLVGDKVTFRNNEKNYIVEVLQINPQAAEDTIQLKRLYPSGAMGSGHMGLGDANSGVFHIEDPFKVKIKLLEIDEDGKAIIEFSECPDGVCIKEEDCENFCYNDVSYYGAEFSTPFDYFQRCLVSHSEVCSNGCQDGACLPEQTCTDTDNGYDGFVKGVTTGYVLGSQNEDTYTDRCAQITPEGGAAWVTECSGSNCVVDEASCMVCDGSDNDHSSCGTRLGNFIYKKSPSDGVLCPNGCQDGACLP